MPNSSDLRVERFVLSHGLEGLSIMSGKGMSATTALFKEIRACAATCSHFGRQGSRNSVPHFATCP